MQVSDDRLIMFGGKAAVGFEFGAFSAVIISMLTAEDNSLSGAVIGLGRVDELDGSQPALSQIDITPEFRHRSRVERALAKFTKSLRINFLNDRVQSWKELRLTAIADEIGGQKIQELLSGQRERHIAMGFSSGSRTFGQAAKAAGAHYSLHAISCHPIVQSGYLAAGYDSLGISMPKRKDIDRKIILEEYREADSIWCPSEFVRSSLVANGVPEEKTFVEPNGISLKSYRVEKKNRNSEGPFRMLFVGNVGVQKGVHVLLEALLSSDIRDAEMIFNGFPDDDGRASIEEYRPKLAKKNIRVIVDPGDPRRYHPKSSVLVLPSLHDAFGLVVAEAMAAGLPVIVSDHAGAHEIVIEGENGFVFSSGHVGELASYLEYFYKDRTQADRLGQSALESVQRFDSHLAARRVLAAIKTIDDNSK